MSKKLRLKKRPALFVSKEGTPFDLRITYPDNKCVYFASWIGIWTESVLTSERIYNSFDYEFVSFL